MYKWVLFGMLYLTNALITPFKGGEATFKERRISVDEAKQIVAQQFTSAIGHQATAQLLTQLLGTAIPMNRTQVFLEPGDKLLAFTLKARPPEGKVLTLEELESIGYELVLVERLE